MTSSQVRLAAFPKCYMDELTIQRSLSLFQWIEMASDLPVDGLELYDGFFPRFDQDYVAKVRSALASHHLQMPMLCFSPDFTQPDPERRQAEVARQRRMIDLVAAFDCPEPRTCRVLSGQRRPDVGVDQGVAWVVECLQQLLPYAAEQRVILAMENHYKDNYWRHPEFAQHLPVLRRIVDQIDSPWFGINFDPSNAILAGEDPLEVLDALKERVVSMHASDRFIRPGHTLAELRRQEDSTGYASILQHGEVGKGLNDYDTIFKTLATAGFRGWVSIEDGMNGIDELRRSAQFLRRKIAACFGGAE
ncbi:MAG TPA: sugar phosphate isomerase/epimerase family protein [Chloroflexota bacterium]|nr:sugar phosphate isomerase/epimerase family protein [Chloroflexota bacterium]